MRDSRNTSKVFFLCFRNIDKQVENTRRSRVFLLTSLSVFRNQKMNTYSCLKFGRNLSPISKYWLNINFFWIFFLGELLVWVGFLFAISPFIINASHSRIFFTKWRLLQWNEARIFTFLVKTSQPQDKIGQLEEGVNLVFENTGNIF